MHLSEQQIATFCQVFNLDKSVAYINDDGREYTAADMDELMCM